MSKNPRPCNIAWIRDIVRQCRDAQVPVFVKQVGSQPIQLPPHNCNYSDGTFLKGRFTGKGGDMSEWPEDIRVRQFPEVKR